jgi:lipid A ethanolaminephosphotransferase
MNYYLSKINQYFKAIKSEITTNQLIMLVALFQITLTNFALFSNVVDVYPFTLQNSGFLISLFLFLTGVIILLLSVACFKYTVKPILIIVLMISSSAAYFMDTYNTIIDDAMVQNIVETDTAESLELLSAKLFIYVFLLGVLPSFFVYRVTIVFSSFWKELVNRLKLFAITLVTIIAVVFIFSDFYSSFFREHKSLRYYSNPSFYIYSTGKYIKSQFKSSFVAVKQIGLDAKVKAHTKRRLVIFVAGETARADRFSLNGYSKNTNPELQKTNAVSFTNVWSCGTSTAISLPCLFSIYTKSEFSNSKASSTENVLDVLKHAGVNLLWMDNNSSSKGVADRIDYESYKSDQRNPICDIECRDEGMVKDLQSKIDSYNQGDIFIVLHQMGNHGPAYYKRYPKEFEKFTPVCKTNQLEKCSVEAIGNAYDNVILYTDYVLSKIIKVLKSNNDTFETAMLYVSDHGESLGENGLYLHGLPYFVAPDSQIHIPMIIWSSDDFSNINKSLLIKRINKKYSHDNVFHTVLGLMGIETEFYQRTLDIVADE